MGNLAELLKESLNSTDPVRVLKDSLRAQERDAKLARVRAAMESLVDGLPQSAVEAITRYTTVERDGHFTICLPRHKPIRYRGTGDGFESNWHHYSFRVGRWPLAKVTDHLAKALLYAEK